MKITSRITAYVTSLLLIGSWVSCSEELPEAVTTVTVPIELCSQHEGPGTRGTANPGKDDELQPPAHLYVWVWVMRGGGTDYVFDYQEFNTQTSDWSYIPGGSGSENQDSRWRFNHTLTYKVVNVAEDASDSPEARVYAIASQHELTISDDMKQNTAAARTAVKNLTLDLAEWSNTDMRDLYSTPGGCAMDYSTLSFGPVRLYHCAAKYDFTWEVAAALQGTTSLSSITLRNLPTTCRVFQPTQNPAGTATRTVIGNAEADNRLTPANQWIGRAYTYALQPPAGTVDYTVTFAGSASRPQKEASFTPALLNDTYTGWYRIIANIE